MKCSIVVEVQKTFDSLFELLDVLVLFESSKELLDCDLVSAIYRNSDVACFEKFRMLPAWT